LGKAEDFKFFKILWLCVRRKKIDMFKRALQIFLGFALVTQLAGCFYGGHDDRWHHDHHDSGLDVHVHG